MPGELGHSFNGDVVEEARIEKTVPFLFSADETMDIGQNAPSPVTDDYPGGEPRHAERRDHGEYNPIAVSSGV